MKETTVEIQVEIVRRAWDFWCLSADYWRVGRLFVFTAALALPFGSRLILIAAKAPDVMLRFALAW